MSHCHYSRTFHTIILIGGFILCSLFASGDVMQFNLGGVRKVVAAVTHNQDGYQCEISFVAVACFAPATNRKINLSKSREYAIQALGQSAGVTTGTVKVENLFVARPLNVNGSTASINYKAKNVEVVANSAPLKIMSGSPSASKTQQEPIPKIQSTDDIREKSLLSCFDDIRSTLRDLDASLAEDIAALKPTYNLDDLVADLEQRGTDDYQRLKSEMQDEKLLLSTEKFDLTSEVNEKNRAFVDRLTAAYTALELKISRELNP